YASACVSRSHEEHEHAREIFSLRVSSWTFVLFVMRRRSAGQPVRKRGTPYKTKGHRVTVPSCPADLAPPASHGTCRNQIGDSPGLEQCSCPAAPSADLLESCVNWRAGRKLTVPAVT